MYLELRPRPVSREHARPQPPAGSCRYGGGGAEEPAPVPVGVTSHRTPNPAAHKLDPPEHTQPIPAPPWTQKANGGQNFVQLAWLITQVTQPLSGNRTREARGTSEAVGCGSNRSSGHPAAFGVLVLATGASLGGLTGGQGLAGCPLSASRYPATGD
jgi:hypothetical protein